MPARRGHSATARETCCACRIWSRASTRSTACAAIRRKSRSCRGEAPGDSIVAVTNHYGDRFYYDAGVDNYGSSQTGTLRYRAGVEADNLVGLQESLSLNLRRQ